MTEPAKLDEPLADADYDELEAFLASNGVPLFDGDRQRAGDDPAVRMVACGLER
jgi:hypothetical protein